jgi:amino acid transporter
LPFSAHYGFSLLFFYLVAGVLFFLPVSFVAAELATAWPKTGGIYIWVKEAFGRRLGFLTIWLQWIYNIVWYPTILAFLVSTLIYVISPEVTKSKYALFFIITSTFWLTTLVNCFGMKVSSLVSALGAVVGTLLPIFFIIALAVYWLYSGGTSHLDISWNAFWPKINSLQNLVFFSAILFGLVGMEMSAVHAGEVKKPKRDYPVAVFYSTIIIFSTLVLGSLAIAMVVPSAELNYMTGLMEAFNAFFKAYHMAWLTPITALLIILGGVCMVSTWVIGPAKGLMVAAEDGVLPDFMSRRNRFGAPYNLLLTQAIIVTLLSLLFVFADDLTESYWLLSDLTAQLALLAYVLMFSAAICLRYKKSEVTRPYRVPGPNWVFYGLCLMGLCTSLFVIVLGFVPPSNIKVSNLFFYEGFLWGGMVVFVVLPWAFAYCRTRKD